MADELKHRLAYKLTEASAVTGIPESTLSTLIRKKKLAVSRYGDRAFVIRRETLERLLREIEVQG